MNGDKAAREQADYIPQPSLKEAASACCEVLPVSTSKLYFPAEKYNLPETNDTSVSRSVGECAEVPTDKRPGASGELQGKLSSNPAIRKSIPLCTGLLDYFPDALAAVAHCSKVGNDQHNAGEPLHWAREKSADHADCIMRHLVDRGKVDEDGVAHSAKAAWRCLALLQLEIEANR